MKQGSAPPAQILVCQAGACRGQGSEAVLLEIEELAKDLGGCTVQPSGCVGACRQAPNAVVIRQGSQKLCTRIKDVERSASVVQEATGQKPPLDDPTVRKHLTNARQLRIRQQARIDGKWNIALSGLVGSVLNEPGALSSQLHLELFELFKCAGHWEQALEQLVEVRKAAPRDIYHPRHIQLLMEHVKLLGNLGHEHEIDNMKEQVVRRYSNPEDSQVKIELREFMDKCKAINAHVEGYHRRIENYALWYLERVTRVSKHSAIYHFMSRDVTRGTPNPRGLLGTIQHKTWHTTMLAKIGSNVEGPLPWVERDYTPISSAEEWEQGRCDILIKIYKTGLASSWLCEQPLGCAVWLSQPRKTLDVPSLVHDRTEFAFSPASYLLVLAGTGIVVASQILQHVNSNPWRCFGARPVIASPISLMYCCRRDDVLMTADLMDWCTEGKLQRCTLAVTEPQTELAPPFPTVDIENLTSLASLRNVTLVHSQLSQELLDKELRSLSSPCKIVVSGPEGFNSAVRSMLSQQGVGCEAVTVLSA